MTRTGRNRRSHGQAVVEFAVAAPLLFLMLWGMIDFGRAYFQYISLVNAVRDGARYAAANFIANSAAASAPKNTIQGRIQDASGGLAILNDGTHIVVQYYDTHCATGCATTPKLCAHYDLATASIKWDTGYSAPSGGVQSCPFEGDAVLVTAKYNFKPTTPLIGQILPSLALTATAETRIE